MAQLLGGSENEGINCEKKKWTKITRHNQNVEFSEKPRKELWMEVMLVICKIPNHFLEI